MRKTIRRVLLNARGSQQVVIIDYKKEEVIFNGIVSGAIEVMSTLENKSFFETECESDTSCDILAIIIGG